MQLSPAQFGMLHTPTLATMYPALGPLATLSMSATDYKEEKKSTLENQKEG